MKKYSLKRILSENEETNPSEAEVVTQPSPSPEAVATQRLVPNLFNDGMGVEFPVDWTPDWRETSGTHGGYTVVSVSLPPANNDAVIQTVKDGKKTKIKAVDLSEVLLAMYFQHKNYSDVSIQGPKEPFDVAYGNTRWEVKTLEKSAARLGKHGKVAMASRLRRFSIFKDSFSKILGVLNDYSENIEEFGLSNLKNYVENILGLFGERTLSGELPPKVFGTVGKPKERTVTNRETNEKTKQYTYGQVTSFAKSLIQIRKTMLRMDCDLSEVSITIPVGGQPQSISLSQLAKTKRGDLFEILLPLLSAEQSEILQQHMLACKLMAAADDVLMLEKFEDVKEELAKMSIVSARYERGKKGQKRRRDIASAILNDYFAQDPPIHGFCFVKGVGTSDTISFGNTVELHMLDQSQCLLAIEAEELVFDSVSVMAPKIYYKGWGIAEQDDEVDEELQRASRSAEQNEQEEEQQLQAALDAEQGAEVPETELEDIPDLEESSRKNDYEELLTERQKRFWSWAME